jgi:hypothetical protein
MSSWTPSLAASDELVVLAWVDTRDGNEEEYVQVSRDGGDTWSGATRLTTDRMNSWAPSVAVDGETIHLAWFDQMFNEFHLYDAEGRLDEALRVIGVEPEPAPAGVLVSDPANPGELTFYSRALERRVHRKAALLRELVPVWAERGGDPRRVAEMMAEFSQAMWVASRDWEICYLRSDDGGRTWSEVVRLTEVPGGSMRPNLALDGDAVHVVWHDDRSGESGIYVRSSFDRGGSWGDVRQLTGAGGASERPMAAAAGGRLHVLWRAGRGEESGVYLQAVPAADPR